MIEEILRTFKKLEAYFFDSFVVKSGDAKECEEEINFKSYQRVVTLKKRHGKCGSYHHDDGSFFIGDFDENGVRFVKLE